MVLPVYNLKNLNGANGFKVSGSEHHRFAKSAVSAGDINGDGYADVVIGAGTASPNGHSSGATYVVFGSADGFAANLKVSSLDGTNGFRIRGEHADDASGFSVASAGDVNGDGYGDIVIGAPSDGFGGGNPGGASYVVFGKKAGFTADIDLSSLNGTNGFKLSDGKAGDLCGYSVASVGDVNGDGVSDIIVGSPFRSPGKTDAGAVYVVYGKKSGFGANLDLASLDATQGFTITHKLGGIRGGLSVASAGDLNGDGLPDIIIGAKNENPNGSNSGAAYVVFARKSGFGASFDLSGLDGTNGFKINGLAAQDITGWSVAPAGDVNGDGIADIIISAPNSIVLPSSAGMSYVVFGKKSGFGATFDLAALDGGNGFKLAGQAGQKNGASASPAGDVNGDGYADILIGAPGDEDGAGTASVVFGKAGPFDPVVHFANLGPHDGFAYVGTKGDESGTSVATGDVNGDGHPDLIINAAHDTYVVFGSKPPSAVLLTGSGASETLTGSGHDDLLVGHAGDDLVLGKGGWDRLQGGAGDDTLIGGRGWDRLQGGAGDDTLVGGRGRDVLKGGRGSDVMKGGKGADSFEFDALQEVKKGHARDVILDFKRGVDLIDLNHLDAKLGDPGDQDFRWLGRKDFTEHKGELRYETRVEKVIVAGDVNGDGHADFKIEVRGLHKLGDTDFHL